MNRIEAVMFDWAGTSVDFGAVATTAALVDTLAEAGLDVSAAELRTTQAGDWPQYMAGLLAEPQIGAQFRQQHGRGSTGADAAVLARSLDAKLAERAGELATPKPYVLQTVASLRSEDIKIGTTSDLGGTALAALAVQAATQGFAPDCLVSADEVDGWGRPYPYMLFAAMQKLAVREVANVMVVGDTAADIEAALAAGMWSVGVVEGSAEMGLSLPEYQALSVAEQAVLKERVTAAFWAYGADFVVDDISEIFEVMRLIETDLEEEMDD